MKFHTQIEKVEWARELNGARSSGAAVSDDKKKNSTLRPNGNSAKRLKEAASNFSFLAFLSPASIAASLR